MFVEPQPLELLLACEPGALRCYDNIPTFQMVVTRQKWLVVAYISKMSTRGSLIKIHNWVA